MTADHHEVATAKPNLRSADGSDSGHPARPVLFPFSWLLCTLVALACLSATGCGYTHEELFPDGVRTVAVPIFKNRNPELYRDVEFDLTEALVKEIELRTPYKVTAEHGAQTILEGTIVAVNQRTLSVRRKGGLPQELETRVVVDFEWRNQHDGSVLRQRMGFASVGRYAPAQPVGEFFELARHEAVQRAATDIVSVMRKDW